KTGVSADHRGYALGLKAGTATLTLVFQSVNGDTSMIQTTVTVKDTHLAAASVKLENTTYQHKLADSSHFDAYEAMGLTVTDNYGNKYEKGEIKRYNFALGTLFTVTSVEGGSVSVGQDGTVTLTGTVTSFELNAILFNGQQATTYVSVN
ncbi:MAG: S-layer protein, partial [Paenibacillaceae bacterium]|nr:S-layer protein [Paenibacillaceae bacterium]